MSVCVCVCVVGHAYVDQRYSPRSLDHSFASTITISCLPHPVA